MHRRTHALKNGKRMGESSGLTVHTRGWITASQTLWTPWNHGSAEAWKQEIRGGKKRDGPITDALNLMSSKHSGKAVFRKTLNVEECYLPGRPTGQELERKDHCGLACMKR